MDSQLEFSTQAYCKMVMHAMKYPHSVCSGLLLSPRPKDMDKQVKDDGDDNNSEEAPTTGAANSSAQNVDDTNDDIGPNKTRIIEAIPISHASHCITPNIEIAYNSVNIYAQQQQLVICGFYQTDRYNEPPCSDTFSQRVTEKLSESYPNAVLCLVSFDCSTPHSLLDPHQLIDGKWRRRGPQSYTIEDDPDVIANNIFFSRDKLYRLIVDFDDHFNNLDVDWTNAMISQKIDYLIANTC